MIKTYKWDGKTVAEISNLRAEGKNKTEAINNLLIEVENILDWNKGQFAKVFKQGNVVFVLHKGLTKGSYNYIGFNGENKGPECIFKAVSDVEAIRITKRDMDRYLEVIT